VSGWRAKAAAILSDSGSVWHASPPLAKTATTAITVPTFDPGEGFVSYGGFGNCRDDHGLRAQRLVRLARAAPIGVSEQAWRTRFRHAFAFETA
jgi:hypothetical protein